MSLGWVLSLRFLFSIDNIWDLGWSEAGLVGQTCDALRAIVVAILKVQSREILFLLLNSVLEERIKCKSILELHICTRTLLGCIIELQCRFTWNILFLFIGYQINIRLH